ncbi:BglII/BstYI family type II restriction endonuclease [Bradyrhizobium sp. USDA 3315]
MSDERDDDEEQLEEGADDDVSLRPNENADDRELVERLVPPKIREKYEIVSYRNAAVILSQARNGEFEDILRALEDFTLTTQMIRTAGGNESDIPKEFSKVLRPLGWHETIISADLDVTLKWKEPVPSKAKKQKFEKKSRIIKREKYLDGHKIDYVKGKVAFDLEWNSKDQTFDRDLVAMNAFFLSGAIDVGVLVTRSASLDDVFRSVGPALTKTGTVEKDRKGNDRPTMSKYGASTTWMGKLVYRLNAGRNGGCPVLAVGITPKAVTDWKSPGKA